MPKIISYTPSWLSRPSAGFDLFYKTKTSSTSESAARESVQSENRPKGNNNHVRHRRTIARRGTEIFVVVDNEIRWSDLCLLRDIWEDCQSHGMRRRKSNGMATFEGVKGLEKENYAKDSYRVRELLSTTFNSGSWFLRSV